ncbi:conserved hypothetical protein [Leishmania infantum JPCM5]|uniref:Uncharacterized protein n=2 Tax=Leishmania infantum TaxID=5671 RepID=A4I322_LEIIN|nr:conserved hypothetical protein [Leishmania infantum JPCM5]CAC9500683.1 hypothetical_protein_-_conserved [Leishmania infantum]CAM69175.1 conserved hypothetical protein [Leishmania infantum JPCM5]SUZ43127.1 hypothetical_protein_-_conserved [Leishmania infantum]|eukprot:XP_001466455.1 conserved hypothetical protein [Leishmania infantum JPCM5]
MTGGARSQLQTMSLSATRLVDVDEAVRILHAACQRRASADALAPLVQSAQHLASNCTPALFSSVLEACDATTAVEAAPKKLTMLNAAWKLLLTIATQEGVGPAYYSAAVVHMVEQLRWGVLTHDWSDTKRVRLAAFFASHVVSTVRAHPQLLLLRTPDATAVIGQLVRLYFAVCVTVATSKRDTEAVSLLYDNIVVRLHAVFDCLGNAAAASTASVYSSEPEAEATCSAEEANRDGAASSSARGEAASGPSAALPPQQRCESPSSVVEELLTHCVSTAVAREVEEAADGGMTVRMALATAALSLYLHVVRGALEATSPSAAGTGAGSATQKGDPSQRDAEEDEAAAAEATPAQASSWPRLTPLATQELVMKSLMWWTHCTAEEGKAHTSATRASLLQVEVLTWAAALPPDVFCSEASDASSAVPPMSLRALWTDTLATVWQQWLFSVCDASQQSNEPSCAGAAGSLRASESHGAEAMAPAAELDTSGPRDGKTEPPVVVAKSTRFASLLLSSVAGTLHSSSAALMVLEAWAELFRRAEEAVTDVASAVPSPGILSTADDAVTIVHLLLRVLADLRCGASSLVEGFLRLQRHHFQDGRCKAGSEQPADFGSAHAMVAIPLQWICAAVALLAYGEEVLGLHSPCAVATAGVECVGEVDGAAAARVITHLTAVMRAHITPQLCASKASEMATITEAPAVTDATAQMRELLMSVRQHASAGGTGQTSASVKLARRAQPALLLLGVPRAWRALAVAVARHRPNAPADADGADAAERCAMELKTVLLSLAPLLASLTHILQSLECEPGLSEASEGSEMPSGLPYASVARWVAARLLDEVAVVPLTDSPEDAVLVACVRRWTDIAFASGTCSASDGSAAVHTDDPVALADAAAALLHVLECTTLPLEKLHLSEHATHSLMELLQGGDGSISGEVNKVGGDDDADGRCPSWPALWHREAVQWCEMEKWLLARRRAMEESEEAEELASAPTLAEELYAAPLHMDATAPPSSNEDLRRGLLYCEAVLRHLQARNLVFLDDTENQSKRRKTENGDDPQAAVAAVVQSVERIQELSRAVLLRAGNASRTATSGSTAAIDRAPLPPPPPAGSLKASAPPGSEEETCRDVPAITLTDTESVGCRRVPLSAQVIDVG